MDKELDDIRKKKEELLKKMLKMPNEVLHLKNYQELSNVINQYPNKIVIIDCSAVWCGPCKWFSPIFEQLQKEFKMDFIFTKVDVDEARDIAVNFGIRAVPTTLFIKGGNIIKKVEGAMKYEQMKPILLQIKA